MTKKFSDALNLIPRLINCMGLKPSLLYMLFSLKLIKLNQKKIFTTKSSINIPLIDKKIFLYYNEYNENDIVKYIKTTKNYNTFINIGAAYGEFLFFSAINPQFDFIHGFEPLPSHFKIIKEVLKMNPKYAKKIRIYNIALGNSTGSTKFYFDIKTSTSSSLSQSSSCQEIEVNINKLDDLNLKITKTPLLLIDVEGYEIKVLKGAKDFIRKYSPTIIIEVWDKEVPQYKKSISEINYKIDYIWEKKKSTTKYWKISPINSKLT